MCIETLTRHRTCTHTRLHHWSYCSILIPSDRLPSTGRSCRLYKLRYKEGGAGCVECMQERKISSATGF
ncbi:hypothetical protein EJ02DRAFT_318161, partial [Clathrospora elynae]